MRELAPTFWSYWQRLRRQMDAEASGWARDNLGWALLMAIAPIAVACFVYPLSVEWRVLIVTFAIYAGSILIYGLVHLARAPWKLDIQRLEEIEEARAAKVTAENQLRSVHTAKDRKVDWQRLEIKFVKESSQIYAGWEKIDKDGVQRTWMFGGTQGHTERAEFELLLEEAGRLVLSSHFIKEHHPELFRIECPMERWFETVCVIEQPPPAITGSGHHMDKGKRIKTVSGTVDRIAQHSSTACKRLAVKENYPPML
jgi:hypothetical protein